MACFGRLATIPIQDIPLQRIDASAATKVMARFAPDVTPNAPELVSAIEAALGLSL